MQNGLVKSRYLKSSVLKIGLCHLELQILQIFCVLLAPALPLCDHHLLLYVVLDLELNRISHFVVPAVGLCSATSIYGWVCGERRPRLLCRALPRSTHFLPRKPNPVLGSDLHILSCPVSYCILANKHVTTDAPVYHCLKHDLSTLLRGGTLSRSEPASLERLLTLGRPGAPLP